MLLVREWEFRRQLNAGALKGSQTVPFFNKKMEETLITCKIYGMPVLKMAMGEVSTEPVYSIPNFCFWTEWSTTEKKSKVI